MQVHDVPALLVRDLVKDYASADGVTRAVDGVSLRLERGQVLALLGPNGAGKTTTIEICEGFRSRDGGSVEVFGMDPRESARDLKPRVGVMLQDGVGGYTAATAAELLTLFGTYAAHPQDPHALLDAVGLTEIAGRQVKRLSGGQQQRLSLALALVARPELVFLDEPTAGMDPQSRRATWDIVERLRADGVSVVLTTHFLDEAEQLADTVVVIDHGQVVAAGSPADLTRSGSDEQIRLVVSGALDAPALQLALPAGHTLRQTVSGHYLVTGGFDPQLLVLLTTWCAGRGVRIESLAVDRPSLEDVFLDLTGREVRA